MIPQLSQLPRILPLEDPFYITKDQDSNLDSQDMLTSLREIAQNAAHGYETNHSKNGFGNNMNSVCCCLKYVDH